MKSSFRTRVFTTAVAVITAASMAVPTPALAQIQFDGDETVHDTYESETINHDGTTTTMNNYEGAGFWVGSKDGDGEQTITGNGTVDGNIRSNEDLTIKDADITINSNAGAAIAVSDRNNDTSSVTIDNSKVDIEGTKSNTEGIYTSNGDINVVNGSEVTIDQTKSEAASDDASIITTGMYTANGNINIKDSSVDISANKEGKSDGMGAEGTETGKGNVNIENSHVKVDASSIAIIALNRTGEDQGKINIVDSVIVAPQGARVQDVAFNVSRNGRDLPFTWKGQVIGKGTDTITSWDSEDILGSVTIEATGTNTVKAAKKLAATGDSSVNPAAIALGAGALIAAGYVVSRRRTQE